MIGNYPSEWNKIHRAVYFVQRGGGDGLIKIGCTVVGIRARLTTLRSQMRGLDGQEAPLTPLLVTPGDLVTEHRMHHRFAALRERGEWFRPGDDLLRFIEAAKANPALVVEIAEATPGPGTPWRNAIAERVEDLCKRTGVGISTWEQRSGLSAINKELRELRSGVPTRIVVVERLAELVGCELMLVPKGKVAAVNRLLAPKGGAS